MDGATRKRGAERWPEAWPPFHPLVAHQRRKTRGRSLHFLPLRCGATTRRVRRGRAGPALCPGGLGESVPTRFQCGFPGTSWTTTARASPSERGALGLLKGRATSCATCARHPPLERVKPIRRHVLDPRRRKSSIMSRPLEAGFSCSQWSIFSMATSKPPWRSTVSCPL